ncbi:MAG: hypothetical protein J4F97_03405, partial [Pseudomonadales bacterium]|nr:hypothetical protein [Pseudomonadales bacterium]
SGHCSRTDRWMPTQAAWWANADLPETVGASLTCSPLLDAGSGCLQGPKGQTSRQITAKAA